MNISFNDVRGFVLRNQQESLGHVHDFFFDDRTWYGKFLIVDTGSWFSSHQVLLSMIEVKSIQIDDQAVETSLTQRSIQDSHPVATHQPVSEQEKQHWYLTADVGT